MQYTSTESIPTDNATSAIDNTTACCPVLIIPCPSETTLLPSLSLQFNSIPPLVKSDIIYSFIVKTTGIIPSYQFIRKLISITEENENIIKYLDLTQDWTIISIGHVIKVRDNRIYKYVMSKEHSVNSIGYNMSIMYSEVGEEVTVYFYVIF
jgi:hypothetical protein